MKSSHYILLLLLIGSIVPLFFLNRWLQKLVQPRISLLRLFLWMLLMLICIFAISMGLVWIVAQVFTPA